MNQENQEKPQLNSQQMGAILLKFSSGAELKCPICEEELASRVERGDLLFGQKSEVPVFEWLYVDCVNGHTGNILIGV